MFFTWFFKRSRPMSQCCTTVHKHDGTWSARVDVNGYPTKHDALKAAGAMFDLVTLARGAGRERLEAEQVEPATTGKVLQFPKRGA